MLPLYRCLAGQQENLKSASALCDHHIIHHADALLISGDLWNFGESGGEAKGSDIGQALTVRGQDRHALDRHDRGHFGESRQTQLKLAQATQFNNQPPKFVV